VLAARARVDPKTIALIEEGRRDPRLSTLMKLALALGEPLEGLVHGLELGWKGEEEKGKEGERERGTQPVKIAKTDRKLLDLLMVHGGELTATAPQIAAMIGCSERAFWDAVKRQERARRLEVERRRGRGKSDTFRLRLKVQDDPDPPSRGGSHVSAELNSAD